MYVINTVVPRLVHACGVLTAKFDQWPTIVDLQRELHLFAKANKSKEMPIAMIELLMDGVDQCPPLAEYEAQHLVMPPPFQDMYLIITRLP